MKFHLFNVLTVYTLKKSFSGGILLLFALACVAGPAYAMTFQPRELSKSAADWRSHITAQEFEDLLRQKVAEISILKELWEDLHSNPAKRKSVFLGGGAVRGLIQWLELQLQESNINVVRRTPPPAFDKLIMEGADRDLFLFGAINQDLLPENYRRENGWDVLDSAFLEASLRAGGSNIEKLGINPFFVYDPTGTIQDYHRGELRYTIVPEDQFKPFRNSWGGHSQFTQIMRHVRFLLMFVTSTRISTHQIESLRQTLESETESARSNSHNIKKALRKLELQSQASNIELWPLLASLGLERHLLKRGYLNWAYVKNRLGNGPEINFEFLRELYKINSGYLIEAIEESLPKARSSLEFAQVLFAGAQDPDPILKQRMGELWVQNAAHFSINFRPTVEEFAKVKELMTIPLPDFLKVQTEVAAHAMSPSERIEFMRQPSWVTKALETRIGPRLCNRLFQEQN